MANTQTPRQQQQQTTCTLQGQNIIVPSKFLQVRNGVVQIPIRAFGQLSSTMRTWYGAQRKLANAQSAQGGNRGRGRPAKEKANAAG